jgi:hypothetical protein
MEHDHNVSDMVDEVLMRQARAHAARTGERLEEALAARPRPAASYETYARARTATRGRRTGKRPSPASGKRSGSSTRARRHKRGPEPRRLISQLLLRIEPHTARRSFKGGSPRKLRRPVTPARAFRLASGRLSTTRRGPTTPRHFWLRTPPSWRGSSDTGLRRKEEPGWPSCGSGR